MPVLASVASLIDSLNTGEIAIYRRPPATKNAQGQWEQAAATLIAVVPAVVHTSTGRITNQARDADRTREQIEVYTKVRLYGSEDAAEADVIEYVGGSSPARYRVSNTNDYTVQGGVWFAMAERLQPSEWAP